MFLPAGRGTTLQSRSSRIIPLWERFLCTARRQISLFSKSPRRAIPFREVSLERVWLDSPPDGVVKSEYTANELCDFAYLPERQLYKTGRTRSFHTSTHLIRTTICICSSFSFPVDPLPTFCPSGFQHIPLRMTSTSAIQPMKRRGAIPSSTSSYHRTSKVVVKLCRDV